MRCRRWSTTSRRRGGARSMRCLPPASSWWSRCAIRTAAIGLRNGRTGTGARRCRRIRPRVSTLKPGRGRARTTTGSIRTATGCRWCIRRRRPAPSCFIGGARMCSPTTTRWARTTPSFSSPACRRATTRSHRRRSSISRRRSPHSTPGPSTRRDFFTTASRDSTIFIPAKVRPTPICTGRSASCLSRPAPGATCRRARTAC